MKWLLVGLGAVVVLAAAGVVAAVVFLRAEPEDIRGSSVEFVPTEPATPPAPPPSAQPELAGIVWPTYGYTNERIRSVAFRHRPPFRAIWRFGARNLVEFPPVIAYNRLYFANGSGVVYAVNAETGKRAWRRERGRCTAASPAVSGHTVFMTFLNRPPCNRQPSARLTGELVAFSTGVGKVRWRKLIGPSETSPLVADRTVYVGDWHGSVWALDERDGSVRWRFRTRGEVKGALTLSGRRLYVGSYDHHLYALNARTGRVLWRAQAQKRPFRDRGRFYSTPTAAYGRVYVGATDGRVYSFGATTGKLRWSQSTGGYVYASPAIWRKRVLVGSYSGRFYAFDAATGDERWEFRANGPISGSPTVVNGIVYFSTLKERTYALDARNGKLLWSFPDGKYTPVVADAERLYLVGHARVYGMVESTG